MRAKLVFLETGPILNSQTLYGVRIRLVTEGIWPYYPDTVRRYSI